MKITLLMPVLNELEGMKIIFPLLPRALFHQILVIDGQSTDGSADFAREQGMQVHVQNSPGIRFAYREAWPLITGDAVITFSPDGNCLPEVIPELIRKLHDSYDMVVASRYLGGAQSQDDDLLTRFGNWMFTSLINRLHGGHYTDAMGMFRAYRKSLYDELELNADAAYWPEHWLGTIVGVEPLLSIRAAKRKLKVTDILGLEPARIAGVRKLQPFRWGLVYLIQTLRELMVWR